MAGSPFDFEDQAQGQQPAANPMGNVAQISSEWANALNDPQVRGSLLQFGINMLQPPSFGDSFGSQFGRAIGGAGEYLTRLDEEKRKQEEAASKDTLRTAQADSATSRAAAAQTSANAAADRATNQREKLATDRERMSLTDTIKRQGRQIQATGAYQRYVTDTNKRNNDVMRDPKAPKEPVMTEQQFYQKFGYGDLLGGGSTAPVGSLEQQAQDAIAKGADPDAVRQRYREKTGQEPNF